MNHGTGQIVSIAEAILWGEQLFNKINGSGDPFLFQSQRRFFGGSNDKIRRYSLGFKSVSIAEAILWGEQHG